MPFTKEQMAARAAREIAPGSVVNLGIGLPTLVTQFVDDDDDVFFHSENGLLGMGPPPWDGEEDPQLINAGKQTVTVLPGGSTFDSALSFSMIRGGHVDLAILGAMQVSCAGDLANWSIPGGKTMGIGGAMDLSTGSRRIIVMMMHKARDGQSKLVPTCDYPLTARGVVSLVISDLGVFAPRGKHFSIVELAPDVTEVQALRATQALIL